MVLTISISDLIVCVMLLTLCIVLMLMLSTLLSELVNSQKIAGLEKCVYVIRRVDSKIIVRKIC